MSFPALVALFIALSLSLRIAKTFGQGLVSDRSKLIGYEDRSQVGLVLEELFLQDGPLVLKRVLTGDSATLRQIDVTFRNLDEIQIHSSKATLISVLHNTFVERCGCSLSGIMTVVWTTVAFPDQQGLGKDVAVLKEMERWDYATQCPV
ncbi:hypothetical protein LTS18_004840 [Coniosporium uncinatum]|uniref:Uncharacterized protein n=1 Tax=Coniosporium uncinatum TaxID=93489 RepID=A0ACC3D5Q8_9PEZI|nr:hypothetical protein LTS18_004840 [Coniosporium uncinatum]